MIYDYVNTKPPLNEKTLEEYGATIQHGWLKDQAAKIHKYIKRWRGPNGKWVYQYANNAVNTAKKAGNNLKLKALDLKTKFNRRIRGMSPDQISMKNGTFTFARKDNGKALSTTRPYGNRVYNGERELYNNGYSKKAIEKNYKGGSPMGSSDLNAYYRRKEKAESQTRKEAKQGKQKTEKIKSSGYKQGNLSNRGFSSSSSGGNNAATKNSPVVRKSKNKKSLSNRGYSDSKKITSYRKKGSLLGRGFPNSRIYGNNPERYDPYAKNYTFQRWETPKGFDIGKERRIEGNAGANLNYATYNDIDRYGIGGVTERKKNKQRNARLKDKVK